MHVYLRLDLGNWPAFGPEPDCFSCDCSLRLGCQLHQCSKLNDGDDYEPMQNSVEIDHNVESII